MDGGRNANILILFSTHHHNQFLTVRLYIFRLPSHRSSIPPSLLHPALSAELSTGMVGGNRGWYLRIVRREGNAINEKCQGRQSFKRKATKPTYQSPVKGTDNQTRPSTS